MKRIAILLLICGISTISMAQVVSNYTLLVNHDTSPLRGTIDNKKVVLNFEKADVLTITFKEIENDILKKNNSD